MASLEPFDPKKHKPIDTVAGNKATEYTTTMESPDGKIWNIPQIWFDEKTKEPKYLAGDKAWDAAAKYEERTKKKFPRFNSIKEGDTAAQERSNAGGATDKSLAYAEGGLNESPSWLDRMQGFFTKEEKDLSLSNVPLFDRPMDATNDDIKIGEDELGNPRYRTMFGVEYTVSLAPDQRSSMGKFKQDVVPAVQDYLEDPSLPTGKQVVDTGKAVAKGIYDTVSIPKKLFTGKMGASEVTVGDVLDIAGGAALGSIGFKVPEGSTRMFGGASAKKLDTTNFATAEKRLNEQKALNPDVETDLEANRKIWKETGWFIDPADKRWRFEVDDKAAGFKDLSNNPWIEGKSTYKSNPIAPVSTNAYSATYKVGDVFEHKELYKRYPHLKDFEVTFSDPALDPTLGPNIEGYMNVANKRLVISKEAANSPDGYRAVMLHELQHAVQEYEGFTRGNNPKRINPALLSKVDAEIDALISEANNRAIELRTELNMSGITDAQIKSADFEKLVQDPKLLSAQKELKDLAFNKIPELENSRQNSAYEFYLGTGGEIESRLVEYRRNLDKGNRKISFPLDSRKKLLDYNKIPPDRVGLDDESVTSRPTGSVYSDIRIPVNPKVALDDTVTAEAVKSMLSKNKNTKQVADMKLGDIMKDENGADAWEFSGWTFKEISRRDVVDHGGPSFILDAEPGLKSYKKDPVLIPQAKFKSLDPNAAPHDRIKKVDLDSIIYESDLSTFKPTNTSSFRDKAPLFDRVKDKLGFAQGGAAMRTDDQMKLYALGGMNDDGMDVDPISGNEIPPGSMAREVRDDIPAQLSDGEYVVPADVVRFFGVKYFEDLRQEAKMGLQAMESDGRIGGEPVEMGKGLTEGDLAALEEMTRTGVASGGLMDKLAYTAMNDPMVNQRLNAGGLPVKFAVGGLAQSQYSNPNQVDQIINRITSAVQQKPELMQQLASRGISVNRTEANVPAQDLQKDNSPSQTTNPIMAAAGTYVNPSNVGFQAPMYVPPEFGTLGGSYFTPQQYGLPPTPVAAPAPVEPVAPPTCPPGYMWDAASNSCVSAGGNNDDGPDYDIEPEEAGPPKINYFDKDFDLSSVGADGLGGVGKAVQAGSFLLGGGPGLAFSGVINTAKQSESIANTRMAAMIAQAKGDTKLADTLNARAKEMLGQASGMTKGIAELGGLRGVNYLAKQLEHYAPAGFDVSKITGLNERQMKRLEDAYAKNPTSTAKAVTAAGAGSQTLEPRVNNDSSGNGKSIFDKPDKERQAIQKATIAETKTAGYGKDPSTVKTSAPASAKSSTGSVKSKSGTADQKKRESSQFGALNKGGLMARSK
jgi:hypothetical protein